MFSQESSIRVWNCLEMGVHVYLIKYIKEVSKIIKTLLSCHLIVSLFLAFFSWLFILLFWLLSHVRLLHDPIYCKPAKLLCPWDFLRHEYWNGLPFPSPGDLPDPVIKLKSPSLAGGFFTTFYNDLSKTVHSGNVIMNFGLFLSFAYCLANMKLFC